LVSKHAHTPIVLVIDRDSSAREPLCEALRAFCKVVSTEGEETALALLGRFTPDLVVMSAGGDEHAGIAQAGKLCARVREKLGSADVAVLVVTGETSERERALILNAGAAELVDRAHGLTDLPARVRALLGTGSQLIAPPARAPETLEFGDLELDLRQRLVSRTGRPIQLTPNEFKLLRFFMLRPETTVTRDTILRDVWRDLQGNDRTIDAHICNLRRKLGSKRARIVTIYGKGYALRLTDQA
jgi:two-component system OmpR family response regulator